MTGTPGTYGGDGPLAPSDLEKYEARMEELAHSLFWETSALTRSDFRFLADFIQSHLSDFPTTADVLTLLSKAGR